jgi:hypothetical protein
MSENVEATSHSSKGLHGLYRDSFTFYPSYLEAVSFIRNLRTLHVVVTRDPTNMTLIGISGA